MPLPPLPPSNTLRYFMDYHNVQNAHTFMVRANAIVSPATMGGLVNSIFTQAANICASITFDTMRVAVAGSDVTNPVVCGFEGTVYGALGATEFSEVTSLNFIGRTSGGRRTKFQIFGFRNSVSNWRLTSGEDARVLSIVGTANTGTNVFLGIDGIKAVWYPYANVSANAYWQRAERV